MPLQYKSIVDLFHNTITAWIVLTCSLLITLLGWYIANEYARGREDDRFAFQVEEAHRAITKRMQEYEQVLRGGVGLFKASHTVNRKDWRIYVKTLQIDTYWPGIQGIGFSKMLDPDQVATHERKIREEGFPEYTLHPSGEREIYSAIVFLEPFDWRNRRAFGYDMFSEPTRRAAMETARDSGLSAVSGRVTLVQETQLDVQAGFLMYLPLYHTDMPTGSVAERRAALRGFVYSPFRVTDLLKGILGPGTPQLNFRIYDGESTEQPNLLYVLESTTQNGHSPKYSTTDRIELPGRIWTVQFDSLPRFEEEMVSKQPQIIAIGGVIVDILLFSIIWSLAGQRERVHRQVESMTRELHLSEARYRTVVEQVKEVIFQADAEVCWTFLNPAWEELTGIRVKEALGSSVFDFIHPEDREYTKAMFVTLLQCSDGSCHEEFRCRLHTESLCWVEVHARSTLDENGKRIDGISGSLIDITKRKAAEEEIQALNQNLERRVQERTAELQAKEVQLREALQAQEKREREFRTLSENLPDIILRTDSEGRLLYVNPAMEHYFGLHVEESIGRTLSEIFPDGRFNSVDLAMRQVATEYTPLEIDHHFSNNNGKARYFAINIVPEHSTEFNQMRVLAVGRDLTRQKEDEEQLRLAASVFHSSSEGVFVTDTVPIILSVNPAFCDITGYREAEVIGQNPSMLRSERHDQDYYQSMWNDLQTDGIWQGEIWNRRKNGEAFLEWLTINRIDDNNGVPIRYVAVFHDITELRKKDERIRHLAFHDALTGLPNRSLLQDRLRKAIERAERKKRRFAVAFMDLDNFKGINDSLGHDIGDLLLKEVAHRIRKRLRRMDTAARMGGDEFVLLMEDMEEPDHCAGLAEGILKAIAPPMKLRSHSVQVGVSIGIAVFPEDGKDPVTLMKHADTAMYVSKEAGRNTYRFFQPQMLRHTTERMRLEMDLRRAVTEGELELFFQPRIALDSGRPLGVEALVRWPHSTRGLVSPMEFIPLAEEFGIVGSLGRWVMEEVCRQGALWRDRDLGTIPIAMNISARQLTEYDIAKEIAVLTAEYGLAPAQLEVELTESIVMADPEQLIELFTQLREMGTRVAIDDFGTGYSSLAYLRRLPIDVLKIDRTFVEDVDRNEDDAIIVETILALSKSLGFFTVAEGVETSRQAELLRSLGCNAAQGFWYSPPLPSKELEQWWQTALKSFQA